MIATRPVDFRKGAEGLAALVCGKMKSDPFSGAVYVFRAKRADPRVRDFESVIRTPVSWRPSLSLGNFATRICSQ